MRAFNFVVSISVIFSVAIYLTLNLTRPGFPTEREIVNNEGKKLSVVIVGKFRDTLTIERVTDNERFQIPVHSLSLPDRFFALRLPEKAAPEVPKDIKNPEDPYVTNRLQTIQELEKKAILFGKEISSGALSDLLHRSRVEQLDAVKKEIKTLEVAIETYKYRVHAK